MEEDHYLKKKKKLSRTSHINFTVILSVQIDFTCNSSSSIQIHVLAKMILIKCMGWHVWLMLSPSLPLLSPPHLSRVIVYTYTYKSISFYSSLGDIVELRKYIESNACIINLNYKYVRVSNINRTINMD